MRKKCLFFIYLIKTSDIYTIFKNETDYVFLFSRQEIGSFFSGFSVYVSSDKPTRAFYKTITTDLSNYVITSVLTIYLIQYHAKLL